MNLTEFSIRRPMSSIMLFVSLVAIGLIAAVGLLFLPTIYALLDDLRGSTVRGPDAPAGGQRAPRDAHPTT